MENKADFSNTQKAIDDLVKQLINDFTNHLGREMKNSIPRLMINSKKSRMYKKQILYNLDNKIFLDNKNLARLKKKLLLFIVSMHENDDFYTYKIYKRLGYINYIIEEIIKYPDKADLLILKIESCLISTFN